MWEFNGSDTLDDSDMLEIKPERIRAEPLSIVDDLAYTSLLPVTGGLAVVTGCAVVLYVIRWKAGNKHRGDWLRIAVCGLLCAGFTTATAVLAIARATDY